MVEIRESSGQVGRVGRYACASPSPFCLHHGRRLLKLNSPPGDRAVLARKDEEELCRPVDVFSVQTAGRSPSHPPHLPGGGRRRGTLGFWMVEFLWCACARTGGDEVGHRECFHATAVRLIPRHVVESRPTKYSSGNLNTVLNKGAVVTTVHIRQALRRQGE